MLISTYFTPNTLLLVYKTYNSYIYHDLYITKPKLIVVFKAKINIRDLGFNQFAVLDPYFSLIASIFMVALDWSKFLLAGV